MTKSEISGPRELCRAILFTSPIYGVVKAIDLARVHKGSGKPTVRQGTSRLPGGARFTCSTQFTEGKEVSGRGKKMEIWQDSSVSFAVNFNENARSHRRAPPTLPYAAQQTIDLIGAIRVKRETIDYIVERNARPSTKAPLAIAAGKDSA